MGKTLGKNLVDSHGLSEREKKYIRDSWNVFCRSNPQHGKVIFVALFIKYPDLMQLFPHFKDKKLAGILDTPKFKAHAHAVGSQIGAMVCALDSPIVFGEMVHKNAVNHTSRLGVEPRHFEMLCRVLLGVLQEKLGARMTAAAVASWEKLFQVIFLITKSAYEDVAETSGATSGVNYVTRDTTVNSTDDVFVRESSSKALKERRDSSFCCSRDMEPVSGTSKRPDSRLVKSIKSSKAAKRAPSRKSLIGTEGVGSVKFSGGPDSRNTSSSKNLGSAGPSPKKLP